MYKPSDGGGGGGGGFPVSGTSPSGSGPVVESYYTSNFSSCI